MASQQQRHGRVITVFSAKGGCGKTTIATNLAVALNDGGAYRVCLLDLDLAAGDVASTLSLEPAHTLDEALPLIGNLDAESIKALVTPYRLKLDCLVPPSAPGYGGKIPTILTCELLAVLPDLYDYIVIDTPAPFSAHVLGALDSSHHHVVIATPERLALRKMRRTLDILDMLSYDRRLRRVVINHSDSRLGMSRADIEKMVRTPVAAHIPSIWDVSASINDGVPVTISKPAHPVSKAIRHFARSHLRNGTDTAEIDVHGWPA